MVDIHDMKYVRYNHSSLIFDKTLYVLFGKDGQNFVKSVEYLSLEKE